jgi:hypothetical protein
VLRQEAFDVLHVGAICEAPHAYVAHLVSPQTPRAGRRRLPARESRFDPFAQPARRTSGRSSTRIETLSISRRLARETRAPVAPRPRSGRRPGRSGAPGARRVAPARGSCRGGGGSPGLRRGGPRFLREEAREYHCCVSALAAPHAMGRGRLNRGTPVLSQHIRLPLPRTPRMCWKLPGPEKLPTPRSAAHLRDSQSSDTAYPARLRRLGRSAWPTRLIGRTAEAKPRSPRSRWPSRCT